MSNETFETRQDVFSFIKAEEAAFQLPAQISQGYEWSMAKHIKLSILYPLSQYGTGNSDNKPFVQIIQPILNLQHRAEGFDVKDIILFINNQKNNYKSFIVKKYHEKWLRENNLDEVIDDSVESYCDMGGSLIKDAGGNIPESVPLSRIVFCDQTDILSGPICEKHYLAPDQLKDMEDKRWGDEKYGADITIDELITLSRPYKKTDSTGKETKTPGKYAEIYELHGVLPAWWLKDGEGKDNEFVRQLQIVSFYTTEKGDKQWVRLYRGKERKQIYYLEKRTPKVYGRALGQGGAEELFEPQVWSNYDAIRMKDLLDAASKILFQTSDSAFSKRNNLRDLPNLSVLTHEENHPVSQLDTTPRNIRLFEGAMLEWEQRARVIGAANESIMGESPKAGTPFKLQELITSESHSLHEYRKGKLAKFWENIYRECIIPYIVEEINEGQEFLSELDLDEMQEIAERMAQNQAEEILKNKVLNGKAIREGEREELKEKIKEEFMAGGNKKLIQAVKDELEDSPVDIEISIAGKQKYLAGMTDKLVNVLRFMLSTYNPQTGTFAVFDDPRMMKLFEQIIEYSGLNPLDFSAPAPKKSLSPPMLSPIMASPQAMPAQPMPIK